MLMPNCARKTVLQVTRRVVLLFMESSVVSVADVPAVGAQQLDDELTKLTNDRRLHVGTQGDSDGGLTLSDHREKDCRGEKTEVGQFNRDAVGQRGLTATDQSNSHVAAVLPGSNQAVKELDINLKFFLQRGEFRGAVQLDRRKACTDSRTVQALRPVAWPAVTLDKLLLPFTAKHHHATTCTKRLGQGRDDQAVIFKSLQPGANKAGAECSDGGKCVGIVQVEKQSIAILQVQKAVHVRHPAHAVGAIGDIRNRGVLLTLFFQKIHVVVRTRHYRRLVRARGFEVIHRVMRHAVKHHHRRTVFGEYAAVQQRKDSSACRTARQGAQATCAEQVGQFVFVLFQNRQFAAVF